MESRACRRWQSARGRDIELGHLIRLEDERGRPLAEVGDGGEILHRLLPSQDDRSFVSLRFVDWYGDATFNHLQMPDLINELERLKAATV